MCDQAVPIEFASCTTCTRRESKRCSAPENVKGDQQAEQREHRRLERADVGLNRPAVARDRALPQPAAELQRQQDAEEGAGGARAADDPRVDEVEDQEFFSATR
jgi:hypothetical protein